MNYLNHSYFYAFDDRQGWNYTVFFSFWNDFNRHDVGIEYVEFLFMLLLFIVSLAVNFTLIVIFAAKRRLRSNQNMYVIAIMINSILLLPFSMLIGITRLSPSGWQFGNTGCQFTMYAIVATAFSKAWLMAMISIDRYVKVVRGRGISRTLTIVFILLVVTIPSVSTAIMAFPNTYTKTIDSTDEQITICTAIFKYHPSVRVSLAYFVTLFTMFFLIPLVVIIVCYSLIMKAVAKSTRSLSRHKSTPQNRKIESNRQKSRTTKILVLIVAVSTIMWLPLFGGLAFATLDMVFESYQMTSSVMFGVIAIIVLNMTIEPFLYSFTSSRVRNEVWMCLKKKPSLMHSSIRETTSASS